MKTCLTLLLSLLISHSLLAQNSAQSIPMVKDQWEAAPGRAEFITHRGIPAMRITPNPEALFAPPGQVVLRDVPFADGTIEFDVELEDFFLTAIYFRRQNGKHAELFYVRTYRADDPTGPDAIQYTELTKGVALWDLHPRYQGPADIKKEGWNRIKLVIAGQRMLVYVNNMNEAVLNIPELSGPSGPGSIAFEGGGVIANLVVTPGRTEGLSTETSFDPTQEDSRYIHHWQVSPPFALPAGRELVSAMLIRAHSDYFPSDTTHWQSIQTERDGLVNLSRRFGQSADRQAVWLKRNIHSKTKQTQTLHLGFSDEVWVLLNDKLVHVDKNLYGHPIMKDAFGQISIDDASFVLPLEEGPNELLIGVANSFFGWAIMARFENREGLTLE